MLVMVLCNPNTLQHVVTWGAQAKARAEGLWNLWLPADMAAKIAHLRERVPQAERHLLIGPGLSNLEYAFLSEVMGRSGMGSEVFNCSAPDTGNMEVIAFLLSPPCVTPSAPHCPAPPKSVWPPHLDIKKLMHIVMAAGVEWTSQRGK